MSANIFCCNCTLKCFQRASLAEVYIGFSAPPQWLYRDTVKIWHPLWLIHSSNKQHACSLIQWWYWKTTFWWCLITKKYAFFGMDIGLYGMDIGLSDKGHHHPWHPWRPVTQGRAWGPPVSLKKCVYTVPVKSLDTPTHSRFFHYFYYFLHFRIIVKTSKLWNNTYGIM